MALFQSELKDTLRRLSNKDFATPQERDELLQRLATTEGLRARDVVWMLFRPDRALREAAVPILQRLRDPETVDFFLAEGKGKPEAAFRAAVPILFTLPGIEQRLPQLLAANDRETQDIARKVLLEAPVTNAIAPLLWQLESGAGADRVQFLARLGTLDIDDRSLARWQRLTRDDNQQVREKALEILATRAPASSVPLFVEQLPLVSYGTQQLLIDALTRTASKSGPELVDRLLPLIASGDAGTRTAVMKILLGMGNPAEVIKRYINFAKTLAGFVRDRALESIRAFGDAVIEPAIELLHDPDDELRGAALGVVSSFEDARMVPPTIALLKDPDWWIRIAAADTLARLKDPRAVEPLIAALADPDLKWSAVEALGRIGDARALPALGRMLGDPQPDVRIEVMQALRHFQHPNVIPALTKVATSDPNRAVRTRAVDILEELAARDRAPQQDAAAVRNAALAARTVEGEPKLHAMLIATRNQGASDFHLSVGQPPMVRLAADLLRAQGEPFTPEQTESMLREILTPHQWEVLTERQQVDFCYYIPQAGRYRGNVFLDHRGYHAVFRVIPEKPPTITDLGLPPHLAEIADYHQGLVLICGPSGSGKSTTLAALVNLFNETRHDHVLMMEDPVEFVHPFKNCLINQREVGTHTGSFARALRAALREDPDVIVIGELRDNESISLALTAAETGHIVLGTLNSTSAPKAIDRIISSFKVDEQPQIRAALSESLKYAVAQRLLPSKQPHKQVAAFEVLKGTSNISSMIRDEKTFQMYSAMQIGKSQGMQTFDEALKDLLRRDQITPETAYMAANKKEDFEAMVSAEFLKGAR
ncbi:MAG TPA: PilT/PilU family type 4a pilus ATPase [Thermoanaerobaculia bacterium]|jgi:twitching motility protein PilT|nr:PilT/PilU family type 4a pilus ATPase [Thermoanaerobaculia bacterium]